MIDGYTASLRIGLDLRFLQVAYRNSANGGVGGVGVYIQGLWRALARLYPENCFVALVDHGDVPPKLRELIALAPHSEIMPFGLMGPALSCVVLIVKNPQGLLAAIRGELQRRGGDR